MSITLGVFLFLLIIACNNEPKTQQKKIVLPNTPELVSKQWQTYLDKNEIDKAITLSTESTKIWLEENKDIFLNDNQIYQTEFIKMNCVIQDKKATCQYAIMEEGELIEDYFLLVKMDNQWLVDLEEESAPELEEQIFKEMEKELNLSPKEDKE